MNSTNENDFHNAQVTRSMKSTDSTPVIKACHPAKLELKSGIMELMGIIVGHLYFFLMYTYPQEMGGPQLISCPQLFYDWFPSSSRGQPGFGAPPQQPGAPRRHNWGTGHVLGGQ